MSAPFRVAIVGSGTSGLAAAVELACAPSDRPISITLFDERPIPGGRTRSVIDRVTGETVDNGQHLMMGCYTSTLHFLKLIGSIHNLTIHSPLTIPYFRPGFGPVGTFRVSSKLPAPINLLFGLLESDLLAPYEKSAAIRLGVGIMLFRYDSAFTQKTCKQLFAATKQPDSLVEKLWEPVILATMNASINVASAQMFLNTIRTVFFMDRRFPSLIVPSCGLSELLIEPAITLLQKHGHEVRLGTGISDADEHSGTVYLKITGHEDYEIFDAIIIAAAPMPQWALNLVEVQPTFQFSPIVNAYLWIDRPILQNPINGFLGTSLQWAFPKASDRHRQLLACTVSAADTLVDLPAENIIEKLTQDIRECFPFEANFVVEHSILIKEKRATYVLDPVTNALRPPTRTKSSHIYLASDVVQNGLPMTIEGAIRNGRRAAMKLAHDHLFIDILETDH